LPKEFKAMSIFKKATLATVLAATALTGASPAMAQTYRGSTTHRGGDATGAAIVGGVIGLALGAIIASSANHRNDANRYADRGWQYRDGYYWDRQGNRYDRDGRRYEERQVENRAPQGYYDRRGYDDRGYGQTDRGYYGRNDDYGQQYSQNGAQRTYRQGY
jgi:hypothetical protein